MNQVAKKVIINYCGGWGYKPKFNLLKATVETNGFKGPIEGIPSKSK